ncbi:MAG: sigma 54-interacting transcriptional regulator [Gemmataceae bacterium]|nr:sigma 54-interacting transcriptional regulator [Gemmataceae bacterium]
MSDTPPEPAAGEPRWQAFVERARDPLFLLNRRRALLFVNRAFEELTGFALARLRGQRCTRHREPPPASVEALLTTLAPPADARQGKPACVRRAVPRPNGPPDWWEVTYLPFSGPRGRLGLLGRIRAVPRPGPPTAQPLPAQLVALRDRATRWFAIERMPTDSPAQKRLVEQVRLAARIDVPVLLSGEPGTGKQWLARVIHRQGRAAERTFALVDCARLPHSTLAAILFGEPGLCWRAHVGTIYLREPARLPRELQARLCQFLAAPPPAGAAHRPRILAGCTVPPLGAVRAGGLLEELYCALSAFSLQLPPLRERMDDLPWLARAMLERLSADGDRPAPEPSAEVWDCLSRHGWPGNLRELYGVLAGACLRAKGERIESAHLPFYLRHPAPSPYPLPPGGEGRVRGPAGRLLPLQSLLERVERRLIELALKQAGHNMTRAADLLAIWRPQLYQRMKALGIEGKKK